MTESLGLPSLTRSIRIVRGEWNVEENHSSEPIITNLFWCCCHSRQTSFKKHNITNIILHKDMQCVLYRAHAQTGFYLKKSLT
jgi:hypothetical protein